MRIFHLSTVSFPGLLSARSNWVWMILLLPITGDSSVLRPMVAHQPSLIARRGEKREENIFFWKCREIAEISGSCLRQKIPPTGLLHLLWSFYCFQSGWKPSRACSHCLMGFFPHWLAVWANNRNKKKNLKKIGRRWKQHFIFENIIKSLSGFSGLGKSSLLFLSHSETM